MFSCVVVCCFLSVWIRAWHGQRGISVLSFDVFTRLFEDHVGMDDGISMDFFISCLVTVSVVLCTGCSHDAHMYSQLVPMCIHMYGYLYIQWIEIHNSR